MTYDELSDDQKLQVKQDLLERLADRGIFIKTMKRWNPDGYSMEAKERDPSCSEILEAGKLVPDEVMRDKCVDYSSEEFEPSEDPECRCTVSWLGNNIAMDKFLKEHPGHVCVDDPNMYKFGCDVLKWAIEKIVG